MLLHVPCNTRIVGARSLSLPNRRVPSAKLGARWDAARTRGVGDTRSISGLGGLRLQRCPRKHSFQCESGNGEVESTVGEKNCDNILELPLQAIRRPLGRTRKNDQGKVKWLMESIAEIGLQEPIDVLEVNGKFYGFSGCHRYEAHAKLGMEKIRCRIIKSTEKTLKMHLM